MQIISKLKRLFSSSSRYFHQDKEILRSYRKDVDLYLQLKGYELHERALYLKAYDYFVVNPDEFDGATMTEDLPDVHGLELAAMLHDYLYIKYKASGSFKYIWMADRLIRSEMRKMNKSSWNTGARFVLLCLKTPFFVPYTWLFKSRRMSLNNKIAFEDLYYQLRKELIRPWYIEFKGELTWIGIILAILLALIWRIDLLKYFLL